MAVDKPIMVRGVELSTWKKLKELKLGSVNKAAARLLNELAKNDELISELLAGDGAESQLRRFVDLLPVLAWGDYCFLQRKSLETLDFYSLILSKPMHQAFPGILQVARHRCAYAALDVALDFERQGLISRRNEDFELADSFVCLAIGFLENYRESSDPKNQAWQTGMAHYNLACAQSQRARQFVYAMFGGSIPQDAVDLILGSADRPDHNAIWRLDSVQDWRKKNSDERSLRLIDSCGREAVRQLRLMSQGPSDHLASWIAETIVDPDLTFIRSDRKFGPQYFDWLKYHQAELEATGNVRQASKGMLETAKKRCVRTAELFDKELRRGV